MTEERFRELLADYLAGELDEQQAAAFRAELEASAERRKLANELQAAAAALEANVLSQEEAEQRTAALQLPDVTPNGLGAGAWIPRRRLVTVLRYAAIVVLAFGAGFLARGWPLQGPEMTRPLPVQMAEVNERYVANFAEATQSFPQSSTFTRSLLMLARK